MPTGILSLKLGRCLNSPTKAAVEQLHHIARQCNRARNAAMRRWVMWREGNPDWTPKQRRLRGGKAKTTADGKPVLENACISQDMENELYYRARDVARDVNSKIISACRGEVVSSLRTKMPYNHDGEAQYRWQAILAYEVNQPTFRGLAIPALKQDLGFGYDGDCIGNGIRPDDAKGNCIVRLPLYSRESGRNNKALLFALDVGTMKDGHRKLLRQIVRGQRDFKDSKITEKDGSWYLRLCVDFPTIDHTLDKTRSATLFPSGKLASRPFLLVWPDSTKWGLGDGKPLAAEFERLAIRRKSIQYQYRDGRGTGHGRNRSYAALRPVTRRMNGLTSRFVRQLVRDIVLGCVKKNCGELVYREPSMPLREHSWLADHGVPLDWTGFLGRLKFQCDKHCIEFRVERIGVKEHKGLWPKDWPEKKQEPTNGKAEAGVAVQPVRRNGRAKRPAVSLVGK